LGRTNEALWAKSKAKAKAKMGGKHSARAMQLAGKYYKDAGGGYSGEKTSAQKSMSKWTKEDWGTKSGKPSTQGPKATGERYLPKKARQALTTKEYAATSAAKREGTKAGKQFVSQPKKIAAKTAKFRKDYMSMAAGVKHYFPQNGAIKTAKSIRVLLIKTLKVAKSHVRRNAHGV
jgi:hypothetical protein